MGVKATSRPSAGQILEWKVDVPALNIRSVRLSRRSSLSISIDSAKTETADVEPLDGQGEEHQQRLACLGDQVGRLAHDIRNPLASIEWFATLLGRAQQSQEERQELSDHCIQAVRSLDQLVSNIVVAGAPLHTDQDTVCLFSLFDEVELLATYPLRKKGVTLQRRGREIVTTIRGNKSLLKQSFLNLLLNAIHASAPGSSIEIEYRNETRLVGEARGKRSKNGIALRIRDYGCGMTENELSYIFRPFYSNRKGGTGLGLSIVKRIVHLHRGVINISSQQGKGTTVDLFFPQ